MANFAARFKQLRKAKGLTQDQIAKDLQVSRSTISMYELGQREPELIDAVKIADYFNVDMDYLTGRSVKTIVMPGRADEYVDLISLYSKLDSYDQETIRIMMERMTNKTK